VGTASRPRPLQMSNNLPFAEKEIGMHTGLHAIRWGLPRLAIAIGIAAFATLIAYAGLVFVIVVVQAVSTFGQ
jgi:hypothetical protein